MPSSAFWVNPTQLERAPTPIFARSSRIIPLSMVAAFPIRRVCLTIEYGSSLCTFSTSFKR